MDFFCFFLLFAFLLDIENRTEKQQPKRKAAFSNVMSPKINIVCSSTYCIILLNPLEKILMTLLCTFDPLDQQTFLRCFRRVLLGVILIWLLFFVNPPSVFLSQIIIFLLLIFFFSFPTKIIMHRKI